MRNTTIADLIKGIKDMDRTLAMPERKGLSKLRKAELVALHSEVLDHFLKVTQPEVDQILAEKFYQCGPCGGTNVLKASRDEHDRQNHLVDLSVNEPVSGAEVAEKWLALSDEQRSHSLEDMKAHLASTPSPQRDYQTAMESLQVIKEAQHQKQADEWFKRQQAAKALQPYRRQGPSSDKIISRPATGPTITVVVQVGRKLVMGQVIGTVTRPSMVNRNLVAVRHLSDAGHPRVTLHAAKECAA